MPTIWEYAELIAAGDTGRWQAATRRAAILLAPTHPVLDLPHGMPVHQVLVQTTALIVHGLGRLPGRIVTARELAAWVADHAVPPDPDLAGPRSLAPAATSDRDRHMREIVRAVRRQQEGLAGLLRAAGHQVPDPGTRSLDRHSADPVVRQWHDLADVDESSPFPLLCLGVAAMADTFGPAII
ncbi:hypothetical protein AB0M02_11740 [Actinoplanes sp. NPDC051861]|uniref:hypothetical protein n=1 Tax=Actinoplanes sp. NPDC051861 TaxID=3155170 RepID=UPI003430299F